LHRAVEHVPTKKYRNTRKQEPPWFNDSARKACSKQRKLYSRYKASGDGTILDKYKYLRRTNKRLLRGIKQSYLHSRLYKPLSEGSSKPFYRYIKNLKGKGNQIMSLDNGQGSLTQDTVEIANTLNSYFNSVFAPRSPLPLLPDIVSGDIVVHKEGVINLLQSLQSGKAPGPNQLTKKHLCLDAEQTASIL
jgi:hypothetical protein